MCRATLERENQWKLAELAHTCTDKVEFKGQSLQESVTFPAIPLEIHVLFSNGFISIDLCACFNHFCHKTCERISRMTSARVCSARFRAGFCRNCSLISKRSLSLLIFFFFLGGGGGRWGGGRGLVGGGGGGGGRAWGVLKTVS